jgi:vacuolar-type H+-ATPase subunit D/Vma8
MSSACKQDLYELASLMQKPEIQMNLFEHDMIPQAEDSGYLATWRVSVEMQVL